MNFEDFAKLRNGIKDGPFTTWQMVLLFGDVVGQICQQEDFQPMHKELSDAEEVLIETLDKFEEAKPYVPEPVAEEA